MNTVLNPDGTVTVNAAGHHRLSELADAAALRFAEEAQAAVDWPALVQTSELTADQYAATFAMNGGIQLALPLSA